MRARANARQVPGFDQPDTSYLQSSKTTRLRFVSTTVTLNLKLSLARTPQAGELYEVMRQLRGSADVMAFDSLVRLAALAGDSTQV